MQTEFVPMVRTTPVMLDMYPDADRENQPEAAAGDPVADRAARDERPD